MADILDKLRYSIPLTSNDYHPSLTKEGVAKAIAHGDNTLSQSVVLSTLTIDDNWVDYIDLCVSSIETIVRAPRSFIKEDRELVSIEKVRRIDGVAIRHLASHTQNVRNVDESGRVEPSKMLSAFWSQDLAIYENRVVYCLIDRTIRFLKDKFHAIKEVASKYDTTTLNAISNFAVGRVKVDCEMTYKVKTPKEDVVAYEKNNEVLDRVRGIVKRLQALGDSDFCNALKSEKPIVPPIMKTNVFAKNVDYRNCYNLWLYIARFTELGFTATSQEKALPFDDAYFADIVDVMAHGAVMMSHNNFLRDEMFDSVPLSPEKSKKYKVVRKIEYEKPSMPSGLIGEDCTLNQYYYEQMRSLLTEIADKSAANTDIDETKALNVNFRKFFKGIQILNNELYAEILGMNDHIEPPKGSSFDAKYEYKNKQIETAAEHEQKAALLVKLKEEELNLAKRKLKTTQTSQVKLKEQLQKMVAAENAKRKKTEERRKRIIDKVRKRK